MKRFLRCLFARGSIQLDRVCTDSVCQVPTPVVDVPGCCQLPILGCTVNRPVACQQLHGTFYPNRKCALFGCVPVNPPPTPTRTATPSATRTPTLTPTASPTKTRINTPSQTGTPTLSPTPTATNTPSETSTRTPIPTLTVTATATPIDTPTSTAADTAAATATDTPTSTSTPTVTTIQTDTATPTSTPSATASASATGTVTPTATPTATATLPPTPSPTPTDTPVVPPPPNPCDLAHALTLPPTIDEIWVEGTPAVLDGNTPITIEGSVDNVAQAFWTDPRQCATDPPPLFHWVINTPLVTGYTARGISGYRADILEIDADSIPKFEPNTITFTFTVTSQVPNPSGVFFSTTKTFRALYRNSGLLIGMSTTCQTMQQTGSGCDIEAALAVVPGTPT